MLCGQGANLATLQVGLRIPRRTASASPSDLLYGIAVAPYSPLTPDLPPNDWRVRLLAGTARHRFRATGRQSYGLASCCYESGVDLSGTHLDPASQKDPRMEAILAAYWAAWKGSGPVLHYNLCNGTGAGKAWGLTDDAADLSQPKLRAAIGRRAPPAARRSP